MRHGTNLSCHVRRRRPERPAAPPEEPPTALTRTPSSSPFRSLRGVGGCLGPPNGMPARSQGARPLLSQRLCARFGGGARVHEQRFALRLEPQERVDLIAFLGAL